MRQPTRRSSALSAVVLAGVVLVGVQPVLESTAAPVDAAASADRLVADATGEVHVTRGTDGVVDFVGAAAGAEIDNPAVSGTTSVRAAADAHLARYGAALGLERPGTSVTYAGRSATASRQDLVRYDQAVGGVPVIGGEVVVTVRRDRQLASVLATLSDATAVPAATVSEADAAEAAVSVVARTTGLDVADLPVAAEGRWVWDPAVLGALDSPQARGTWRFEVGDGESALHTVLVDDRTRGVLVDVDERQGVLDRVVCDRQNEPGDDTPCTSGFARTEASGPSGIADVDNAFVHAGEVADFYQQVAGVDLTQLLGVNVGGVKKLAASVRYCDPAEDCPYANAFWNGVQMFYGDGYAGADDVVGHEMTHGVIDRSSDLFYWGQSGAINESLADVMGEIVDHRNTLVAGDATWPLGEDIPGGPVRNMSNPPAMSDPDRMTSPLYFNGGNADRGGVHFNSGVGNKTAFLISQGGSFNGQTITGIDVGDPTLAKTAALYYDVMTRLTSGSDYANLADVLEQTCQDFLDGGLHGFTAANCTSVQQGGARDPAAAPRRATRRNLRMPRRSARPAVFACSSTARRGTPATAFAAGPTWLRGSSPLWGSNAVSGHDSWYSSDPSTTTTSPLDALVADQPARRATELPVVPAVAGARLRGRDELRRWHRGGRQRRRPRRSGRRLGSVVGQRAGLTPCTAPNTGRKAFGRDSLGWVASRLDLSAWAGAPVRPQFTMRTDVVVGYVGWWLDDIAIYTCDGGTIVTPPVTPTPTPHAHLHAQPDAHPDPDLPEAVRPQRAQGPGWPGPGRRVLAAADHQRRPGDRLPGHVRGHDDRCRRRRPQGRLQGAPEREDVHLRGGRLRHRRVRDACGDRHRQRDGGHAPRCEGRREDPAHRSPEDGADRRRRPGGQGARQAGQQVGQGRQGDDGHRREVLAAPEGHHEAQVPRRLPRWREPHGQPVAAAPPVTAHGGGVGRW